jgi:hypothetical protein
LIFLHTFLSFHNSQLSYLAAERSPFKRGRHYLQHKHHYGCPSLHFPRMERSDNLVSRGPYYERLSSDGGSPTSAQLPPSAYGRKHRIPHTGGSTYPACLSVHQRLTSSFSRAALVEMAPFRRKAFVVFVETVVDTRKPSFMACQAIYFVAIDFLRPDDENWKMKVAAGKSSFWESATARGRGRGGVGDIPLAEWYGLCLYIHGKFVLYGNEQFW